MAQNFGNLNRDLFGSNLFIKGKRVLDSERNLHVRNATINGDLRVKGNLSTSDSFILKQKDFDTGTLRITKQGTYKLVEDIVFDPPYGDLSTRSDTPLNGFWFAIITVECDNVLIDLNGHTLTVSSSYINANLIGSFVNILLGNNQFTGGLFATAQAKYPDSTAYIAANNVLVTNGSVVGAGSHFGIMANNSNSIFINKCNISDCQVSQIYFQHVINSEITNCNLSGSTTPVQITMDQTQVVLMRQQFTQLINGGVPGAAAQLSALNAYVAANPSRFVNPPSQNYPTSLYGIFIVPGPTAIFPFPMTQYTVPISSTFADGGPCENLVINNCTFSNFITNFNEVVDIGSNIPIGTPIGAVPPPFEATWILATFGLFGTIQWKDAFNGPTFSPNAFLQSLVFIMNFVWLNVPAFAPLIPLYPTNSLAIFNSILTSNASQFYSNAAPIVSCQSDGTPNAKGLFGIRVVGSKNVTMNNIEMTDFDSVGIAALDPTTLPGYGSLSSPLAITRSQGNDAWFISLETCSNTNIVNFDGDTINSDHGYVFGVHSAGDNTNTTCSTSSVANMSAPNTIVTSTMDAGDVNAFVVENNIAGQLFQNLTTQNLSAGGTITQFPTASGSITLINCISL
jgi:hypothetical protein